MAHLIEDLCHPSDCATYDENAAENSYPVDTVRTDTTFDVGVGLETFSGLF